MLQVSEAEAVDCPAASGLKAAVWGGSLHPSEPRCWAVLAGMLLFCGFVIKGFVGSLGSGHLTFGDVTFTGVTALAVLHGGRAL